MARRDIDAFLRGLKQIIMGQGKNLKKDQRVIKQEIKKTNTSLEQDLDYFFRSIGQMIYEIIDEWGGDSETERSFEVVFTWICYIADQVFDSMFRKNPKAVNEFMRKFLKGLFQNLTQGFGGTVPNNFVDSEHIGCFWYLISVFGENLKGKTGRRWIRNQFFAHYDEDPEEVLEWLHAIFVFGISLIQGGKGTIHFHATKNEHEIPGSLYDAMTGFMRKDEMMIFIHLEEKIQKSFIQRYEEEYNARKSYQKLIDRFDEVESLTHSEWKLIIEKRRRALRSNGLDRIAFDRAAQLIIHVAEVRLITEGREGPDVDIEVHRIFYGVRAVTKGFLDKNGKIHLYEPHGEVLVKLLNLAVVRAYRNLVVGGDKEFDRESKELKDSAESRVGEKDPVFRTVVQGYIRKLADGLQNSEDTYKNAAKAGYSRAYLDGDNPDNERKNWVDEYGTPSDANHLPVRVPRQVFSTKKLLKLIKE